MTISPERLQELVSLARKSGFSEEEIEACISKPKKVVNKKKEFYESVKSHLLTNNSITKEDMLKLDPSLKLHSNPSVEYKRAIKHAEKELQTEIKGSARTGWSLDSALEDAVSSAIEEAPRGSRIKLKDLTEQNPFLNQTDIVSEFKKRGWSLVAGQSFLEDGV
jgi:hypothetical protein